MIERCVILSDDDLRLLLLPIDFNLNDDGNTMDLASVEKKQIIKVLNYTNGNKTQTAKLLGIGLTTLYQKIKDYHIEEWASSIEYKRPANEMLVGLFLI